MTNTPIETSLCVTCGQCCTGGVFSSLRLQPSDLPLVPRGPDGLMPLPCKMFKEKCTIYAHRPKICSDFECSVLQQVKNGSQSAEWGLAQIAELKSAIAALDPLLPKSDGAFLNRVIGFATLNKDRLKDTDFKAENKDILAKTEAYERALTAFIDVG